MTVFKGEATQPGGERSEKPRYRSAYLQANSETPLGLMHIRLNATKNVRFRAYRRLIRRHKLSSYLIAMLSLYVIGISLLPNIYKFSQNQNQILLACTIILSIFIIILSLSEGYESFHHQAEVFHDSARKIAELASRLQSMRHIDSDVQVRLREEARFAADLKRYEEDYERVLKECALDHSQADYLWVKSVNPHYFPHRMPVSRAAVLLQRIFDWIAAIIAEFAWMIMPLIFAIGAGYVIYRVVLDSPMLTTS